MQRNWGSISKYQTPGAKVAKDREKKRGKTTRKAKHPHTTFVDFKENLSRTFGKKKEKKRKKRQYKHPKNTAFASAPNLPPLDPFPLGIAQ